MKNDVDKGVRALRRALREGDDAAKTAAALALLAFFGYDDDGYGTIPAGIAIVKAGGIPPLVNLLRDGSAEGKAAAAEALHFIELGGRAYQIRVVEAGCIPLFVDLLRDGSAGAKREAERALYELVHQHSWNIADNATNAVAIAAAVGFDALVELARRGHVNVGAARPVRNATLPVKRKAALVAGQLLEAAAPRTRVPREIKAAIASYL